MDLAGMKLQTARHPSYFMDFIVDIVCGLTHAYLIHLHGWAICGRTATMSDLAISISFQFGDSGCHRFEDVRMKHAPA